MALSTIELLNVDDDFVTQLKGVYFSCNYFPDENIDRRKRKLFKKPSGGLFTYHTRVLIPRPVLAFIKAMLIEYHDNDCHPNYRRLVASLLKRFLVGQDDV
jgi:hypothetical protein